MIHKLRAWVRLSRPPFHSVGLLPFILGGALACRHGYRFNCTRFAWGAVGVVLIMLATYYAGEYWDNTEDTLSGRLGASRFAGGSQVVQSGLLPRHAALWASLTSLCLALAVGLLLQFRYRTGPWTLPLGIIGITGGFFYSSRPLRWVTRGWGELWIALCYGWLPVATAYYLLAGRVATAIHWVALPIALTIFNVILLNEFPDYDADLAAGKRNLTVRLGRARAAATYALTAVGSWVGLVLSLWNGAPTRALWFSLPFLLLSALLVMLMLQGRWRERQSLDRLCAANLAVNLGTSAAYVLALIVR